MRRGYKVLAVTCSISLLLQGCFWNNGNDKKEVMREKSEFEEIIRGTDIKGIPKEAKGRKDSLIVGVNSLKGNFNPLYSSDIYDGWANSLLFDGLLTVDEKGQIQPKVAKEWQVSEEGKKYTFKLNDNIKFSDGTDVTAEDIAFTYTALCDPSYKGGLGKKLSKLEGYNEYYIGTSSEVIGINIEDKNTISFYFTEANSSIIYDFQIGILSKKYYFFEKGHIDELEKLKGEPMGCGAYKVASYDEEQKLTLVKNEDYYRGTVPIKNIILKKVSGEESINQLASGEIDAARINTSSDNIKYFENLGFAETHLYDDNGYQYIGLNLRSDKFKDKRIRQALMYGTDREKLVKDYYGESGSVYNAPFALSSWAYPEGVNEYKYDLDKANKLLDEAGWLKKEDGYRYNERGEKFTIKWSTYEGSKYVEALIPFIKDGWKQLGIEVGVEKMPFKDLVEKVYDKRDFEMYNMYWSLAADPDPSAIFSMKEDVPGGYNAVGFRNDESEKLIENGIKENNIEKRKEIYNQWGKLVNEELPYLYLNQNKEMFVANIRVKGLKLSTNNEWTSNILALSLDDTKK